MDLRLKPTFDDSEIISGWESFIDHAKRSEKAYDDFQDTVKNAGKEVGKELVDSIQQTDRVFVGMSKTMSSNLKVLEDLNKRYRESSNIFTRLRDRISNYVKGLKDQQRETNKLTAARIRDLREFKASQNALKDAIKNYQVFGTSIGQTVDLFKTAASVGKNWIRVLGGVKVAIASTGIGLLVVALGSLVSWLQSTEKGTQVINTAFRVLGAVTEVIRDKINDFGETLFNIISNPSEAFDKFIEKIKELPKLVLDNIVTRFQSLGNIIKAAFDLDFETLAKESLDFLTGVDNSAEKVADTLDKAKDKAKEFKDDLQNAVDEGTNLEAAFVRLRREQLKLNEITSLYRAEIEQLKQKSDDVTLSIEDRLKAAQEGFAKEQSLLQQQIELKERELSLTQQEIALQSDPDKFENLEKVSNLRVELNGLIEQSATKQTELQNKTNALLAEQAAKIQEAKDKYEELAQVLRDEVSAAFEQEVTDPVKQLQLELQKTLTGLDNFESQLVSAAKEAGASKEDIKELTDQVQSLRDKAREEFQINVKTVNEVEDIGGLDGLTNDTTIPIRIKPVIPKETFEEAFEGVLNNIGEFFNSDEFKSGFEVASTVADGLTSILDSQIQKYDELIAKRDENVSELQDQLSREQELFDLGLANNLESVQNALDREQELRDEDIKRREEAARKQQRIQLALDTVSQAQNLITASTDIFKNFSKIPVVGVPLAIAAIASMFAAFTSAKVQAFNLTKLYKGGALSDVMEPKTSGVPGGRSDRGSGKGLAVVDAVTGEDTRVRIGGDEFIVNANETANNIDFLRDFNAGKFRGVDLSKILANAELKSTNISASTSGIVLANTAKDNEIKELKKEMSEMNSELKKITQLMLTDTVPVVKKKGEDVEILNVHKRGFGNKKSAIKGRRDA